MDFTDYFRFANLGVAAFLILGGIAQFLAGSILVGIYVIVFALATAALEFQIPPQLVRYCSFYFSFLGRGVFYTFLAAICLNSNMMGTVAGWVIGIVGLAYAALEFVPSIEAPANMREQDGGWGAEGV
ncbi:golgi apparatus membrane protein tvp15-like protein [Zalerion maritima]|uniref:Golgi apparatus membrane protein tvp15-like protein n=1 Tax=Zalerion maritima TaxID=339359 RepID=A0AAD5RJ17_9PEZI|nr:golgi apparatus membrane protein tvp15-like protein [Zalerion maritima]